jgi:mRNA (guanine-N7-)-methyltransferase
MSVLESMERYNAMLQRAARRGQGVFAARFVCGDLHAVRVGDALPPAHRFDLVSCQFAFHYSFESEARARGLLRNASELLRAGGLFVGTMPDANVLVRRQRDGRPLGPANPLCRVDFGRAEGDTRFPAAAPFGIRYNFFLLNAVDGLDEFLVPWPAFEALCGEAGLELVAKSNFHDLFADRLALPHARALLRATRVLDDGGAMHMTAHEWEIAQLYLAFVLRKRETPPPPPPPPSRIAQPPRLGPFAPGDLIELARAPPV